MMQPKDSYLAGYLTGYRDGVRHAFEGKVSPSIDADLLDLPIDAMNLSTRALNCLIGAHCNCIRDVVSLSDLRISTMRNLGIKTASEIAKWLHSQGLCYSAWSRHL